MLIISRITPAVTVLLLVLISVMPWGLGPSFQFAMPEAGIGFFPDVGATWFLPRMPGETGTYCGLTGERLKAADAIATGIATHHVPSARWHELKDALTDTAPVDSVRGSGAPMRIQVSKSAMTCAESRSPFGGIMSSGLVDFRSLMRRLFSGRPGTMAVPLVPPLSMPSLLST